MKITEAAQRYYGKSFPDYESKFLETDPEFIERFDNFAFDEVVKQDDLDDRTRMNALRCVNEAEISNKSVDKTN